MDPVSLISSAPPEFVPYLIIIALAFKAWQIYMLRDKNRNDKTGALG